MQVPFAEHTWVSSGQLYIERVESAQSGSTAPQEQSQPSAASKYEGLHVHPGTRKITVCNKEYILTQNPCEHMCPDSQLSNGRAEFSQSGSKLPQPQSHAVPLA